MDHEHKNSFKKEKNNQWRLSPCQLSVIHSKRIQRKSTFDCIRLYSDMKWNAGIFFECNSCHRRTWIAYISLTIFLNMVWAWILRTRVREIPMLKELLYSSQRLSVIVEREHTYTHADTLDLTHPSSHWDYFISAAASCEFTFTENENIFKPLRLTAFGALPLFVCFCFCFKQMAIMKKNRIFSVETVISLRHFLPLYMNNATPFSS